MPLDPDRSVSRAVRRLAHPRGGAHAVIQFTDQSVYRIEPFLDADFLELSRGKVYPGLYFNCIVKQRDNFRSVKLSAWPDIIGENFAAVLYWTDPVLPLTPTGPAQ